MLPSLDGLALLKAVRAAGLNTPALFLTALSSLEERVAGLKAGGDDYLVKPFAVSELLARLDAITRRPVVAPEATTVRAGDLQIDLLRQSAVRDGKKIPLKPLEFRLLSFLVKHAGAVVTRTMLLESVWGFHFDPHTNIVDTHISRLRAKLDKGFAAPMIETVRGAGYRFNA
jgi:two-component system OmpR family response regulator